MEDEDRATIEEAVPGTDYAEVYDSTGTLLMRVALAPDAAKAARTADHATLTTLLDTPDKDCTTATMVAALKALTRKVA